MSANRGYEMRNQSPQITPRSTISGRRRGRFASPVIWAAADFLASWMPGPVKSAKRVSNASLWRPLFLAACVLVAMGSLTMVGVVSAQALTEFASTYGGAGNDVAYSIIQTTDGGYVFAGDTTSFGASNKDIWVVKLDASGTIVWEKRFGGSGNDGSASAFGGRLSVVQVIQTSDGGYAVAATTDSFGAGSNDAWVLKLDPSGNVVWQKTYGGSSSDAASSIFQTSDGGYVVAGSTLSFGNGYEAWVLKLDPSGNILWQNRYGGAADDYAASIVQTSDGGYAVTGWTYSFGLGGELWVMKLNSGGSVVSHRTYGMGSGFDGGFAIAPTSDGGFAVAGATLGDMWVLKFNADGSVAWQKQYGGTGSEVAESIVQTADGGFAVAGYADSFGGGGDFWILKLDASGSVVWQERYGGGSYEHARSIVQTADGGYAVAGQTFSFGAGGSDAFVIKLDANGNIQGCGIIADTLGGSTPTGAAGASTGVSGNLTSISPATPLNPTVEATAASVSLQCAGAPGADLEITKTDAPDPVTMGNSLTYTVIVTNGGPSPATGVMVTDTLPAGVTFVSATSSQGSCSGTSTVTCNLGTLAKGASATVTIIVTPTTAGMLTNAASVTGAETDPNTGNNTITVLTTVNKADTSTAISSSPNPSVFGQGVTFTATVTVIPPETGTPTGTVTFRDGLTTIGTGTLNSGQASFSTSTLSVGSHSITAVYTGDTTFNGSTSSPLMQTVNKTDTATSITSDSPDPSVVGQAVTVAFSVAVAAPGSGTPTGSVTVTDGAGASCSGTVATGSCVLTPATAGARILMATYAGDGNFNGSTSAGEPHSVNPAGTTTTLTSSANPSVFGQGVTFTAAVSVAAPGAGTPTGTVSFLDGATILGSGTLNASGQATLALASLAVGARPITAQYGGDATFNGSTSAALTQTVNKASTTTALTSSANPSLYGQQVTFTATVSVVAPGAGTRTGTVIFKDGGVAIGTGSLNGAGQATLTTSLLSTGSHTITADYSGDGNFNGSTSPPLGQTVNPAADLAVAKADSPDPVLVGSPLTYTVTVTNNGPSTATGVSLTDTLPAGVTFVSASSGCSVPLGGTVTCNLGALTKGASATVMIVVTPTAAGTHTNTASVSATETDPSLTNNVATASTTVNAAPPPSVGPVFPGAAVNNKLVLLSAAWQSDVPITGCRFLVDGTIIGDATIVPSGPARAGKATILYTFRDELTWFQRLTPKIHQVQARCTNAAGEGGGPNTEVRVWSDTDGDGIADIIDRNRITGRDEAFFTSGDFHFGSLGDNRTFGAVVGSGFAVVPGSPGSGVTVEIGISGPGSSATVAPCTSLWQPRLRTSGQILGLRCDTFPFLFKGIRAPERILLVKDFGAAGQIWHFEVLLEEGKVVYLGSPIGSDSANVGDIAISIRDQAGNIVTSLGLPPGHTIELDISAEGEMILANLGTVPLTMTVNGTTLTLNPGQTTDQCRADGNIAGTGCPVADQIKVELHIIDQAKTGACSGAGSCKQPVALAGVRVFDRNRLKGLSIALPDGSNVSLTKNPDGSLYDDIFESSNANAQAKVAACTTLSNGQCFAGESRIGDLLVIVKVVDVATGKAIYAGRPKSPEDFMDSNGDGVPDLAVKDIQIIKTLKRDGTVEFGGGNKTVLSIR